MVSDHRFQVISLTKIPLLISAVGLLAVSGCGVKWWYDQIDYLLGIRIDRYFDVTEQQEEFITRRLAEHLHWHRYEGLPVHIRFLRETREKLADGVSREEVAWFFRQYRNQLRLLIEQLSSDSVLFLMQLTDEQVDYFEEQLREDNQKYEKRLKQSPEDRLAARADATIDFLEEWLGDLSGEQEARVRQLSLALPDRFESWYRQKLDNQQLLIAALRVRRDGAEIRAALLRMLLPPEPDDNDTHLEPMIDMIQSIDRLATRQQRQHVMNKLQGWVDSLKELSRRET